MSYRPNFKKKSNIDTNHSTALTAVALQDHLIRNLSLDLSNPLNKPRNLNKPQKQKPAKAVVNTHRVSGLTQISKHYGDKSNKEYVLDATSVQLTLAQKLGLVEAPRQRLSEQDWSNVKERSKERQDFKEPCVICKEDFGTKEQALLSCTHVFHKTCIQAFERFTGKKCCPMCRKEQYETRIVYEGTSYYKHKCATRIQATWRGFVVRCWYLKLRETVPPNDPNLRKKFYEQRLHDITERMVKSVDTDIDGFLRDLDRSLEASRDVFRKFDHVTRFISEEDWLDIQIKAANRADVDCPICLTALATAGLVDKCLNKQPETEEQSPLSGKKTSPKTVNNKGQIKPKINSEIQRKGRTPVLKIRSSQDQKSNPEQNISPGQRSCQVQRSSQGQRLDPKQRLSQGEEQQSSKQKISEGQGDLPDNECPVKTDLLRAQVILSCSHVFHQPCLEAFEEFAVGERRNVCPVCRSHYQKRLLLPS